MSLGINLSAFNQVLGLANAERDERVVLNASGGISLRNLEGATAGSATLDPSEVASQNEAVRTALRSAFDSFVEANDAFAQKDDVVNALRAKIDGAGTGVSQELTTSDLRDILTEMAQVDGAFHENLAAFDLVQENANVKGSDSEAVDQLKALLAKKEPESLVALLGKCDKKGLVAAFKELRDASGPSGLSIVALEKLSEKFSTISDLALNRLNPPPGENLANLTDDQIEALETLQLCGYKIALELESIAAARKDTGVQSQNVGSAQGTPQEAEAAKRSLTKEVLSFNTAFAGLEAEAKTLAKNGTDLKLAFQTVLDKLSASVGNLRNKFDELKNVRVTGGLAAMKARVELIDNRLGEFRTALQAGKDIYKLMHNTLAQRQDDFVSLLLEGRIAPLDFIALREQGYTEEMILGSAERKVLEKDAQTLGKGHFNTVTNETFAIDAVGGKKSFALKSDSPINSHSAAYNLGMQGVSNAKLNFAAHQLATIIGARGSVAASGIVLQPNGTDGGKTPKICMEVVKGQTCKKVMFDIKDSSLFVDVPMDLAENSLSAKLTRNLLIGLNRLAWVDAFSGEVDRHKGNILIDIDEKTGRVDVVGIDNDQCFAPKRTGMNEFTLSKKVLLDFEKRVSKEANDLSRKFEETVDVNALLQKAVKMRNDGSFVVKFSPTMTALEGLALSKCLGANSVRTPAFILKDQLERILDLDRRIAAWRNGPDAANPMAHPLVKELAPTLQMPDPKTGVRTLSQNVIAGIISRADSTIAQAKALKDEGKVVYGDDEHARQDAEVFDKIAKESAKMSMLKNCEVTMDLAAIVLGLLEQSDL